MFGHMGVAVDEVPPPEPHRNYVVVKVMASATSGTERRYYDGAMTDPWTGVCENGGHEAAGIVWRAGSGVRVREGDRVVMYSAYRRCGRCRWCLSGRWLFCEDQSETPQAAGCHAQYVLTRDDFCLPLPDDEHFETGALLAAPFGAAWRATRGFGSAPRTGFW